MIWKLSNLIFLCGHVWHPRKFRINRERKHRKGSCLFFFFVINNDQSPHYMWGIIQVCFADSGHLPISGDKYFKIEKTEGMIWFCEASSCVKWHWGIAAKRTEVRGANTFGRRSNMSLIPFPHKPLHLLCLQCVCPLQHKTFKLLNVNFHT